MPPKVSIGLPVYNGANYLDEAIASVVAQTENDWELIIGDNASDDITPDIASTWAKRDDRIRYLRHPENRGAAFNYNSVLEGAVGSYLKWMAHDDLCGPGFLSVCTPYLDSDPSIAMAYPSPVDIDAHGAVLGPRDAGLDFGQDQPCQRFRATTNQAHAVLAVFGVFRRELFDAGVRHGDYPGADRVLLMEMAMFGRIVEVPDQEYFHREHDERYSQRFKNATFEEQAEWFRTGGSANRQIPHLLRARGYASAILRSPITLRQQLCCFAHLAKWTASMRRRLWDDIRSLSG